MIAVLYDHNYSFPFIRFQSQWKETGARGPIIHHPPCSGITIQVTLHVKWVSNHSP